MSPSESKIMMLKRMTRRLQRQMRNVTAPLQRELDATRLREQQLLRRNDTLLKLYCSKSGDAQAGAAIITDELRSSYDWALAYVTKNRFKDGDKVNVIKYPNQEPARFEPDGSLKIVVWRTIKIAEDFYDLEFVKETAI